MLILSITRTPEAGLRIGLLQLYPVVFPAKFKLSAVPIEPHFAIRTRVRLDLIGRSIRMYTLPRGVAQPARASPKRAFA